ncbi:MAG: TonB-dependent receptor [Acidobacteriota bacterium]
MTLRRVSGVVLKACFLLGLAGSALAQDPAGEIHGTVRGTRGGELLGLVQVRITSDSGAEMSAVTDDDGQYRIAAVVPGKYELQATAVGYRITNQDVTLAVGESKVLDLVLTSSAAARTDTVQVSEGFEDTPESSAAAMTIEGEERKNLASVLADDPLRAVQSMPGVSSNNDFSSEFSLRGAPFSRVGLYFDGILLHAPFHTTDGQADNGSLTIFNGDMIDSMTLYEGAWPVRYSNRTAGIVAVQTRDGDRDELHGRFSASVSNASLLMEGPLGKQKRGSWVVAFRKSYLQYILNRIDFGDQAPLSFGFTDGEAHGSYDLSANHTVTVSYIEGASGVDRTRFRDSLGVNSVALSGFRYTLLTAGSRYTPNRRLLVTNRIAWSKERGDVANRDNAALSHDAYGEWTWRGDASIVWEKKNTLDFGGIFRHLSDDGSSSRFIYTPTVVSVLDRFHGTAQNVGGYVQQNLSFVKGKITGALGVRQDAQSNSPVQVTSPYSSLSFTPRPNTTFHLDWGQYAQFPELSQAFSLYASPHLLPTRATHYEVSVEQKLDERTRVRVEFYDRQDRDLLAYSLIDPRILPNGAIFQAVPNAPLQNSQRAYSRGAQIFLQRRSANGFTGWISYAYGRTRVTDGVLSTPSNPVRFPSDYDQPHTFNAYISRRLGPAVNVSARFTYGSGMPYPGFYKLDPNGGYLLSQARNALRAPAYQRTDVRLNKAYTHKRSKATLFVEVVNLTNRHNSDFDSPGPYDGVTGKTYPNFFSMFPILPSAGVVVEF